MELYARNKLIPGPGYIVTETMNERLFIMVCRHFAYAGMIDKILPFREEFESIMLETSYYNRPLYQALHGLLIPFRVGRLPASDHYDPNNPDLIAADPKRTYLYRHWEIDYRKIIGIYRNFDGKLLPSYFTTVSEVFLELLAPNLMILLLFR